MEISKNILNSYLEKCKATSQITLDDDYNVPDYRPDIVKVLKEQGELAFDEPLLVARPSPPAGSTI